MKQLNVLLCLAIVFPIFISCENNVSKDRKLVNEGFLDIDSLVTSQLESLSGKTLMKSVSMDAESEEKEFVPGREDWQQELKVFQDLNINKPAFIGGYTVTSDEKGRVVSFDRKPDQNSGPDFVRLQKNADGSIVRITGQVTEQNTLYDSRRNYSLTFEPESGLLSWYEFSGFQKLVLKDTTRYKIAGNVR